MAEFEAAILWVLKHEFPEGSDGGFNDKASDRGGATKYGISLRFLKAEDIDIDGDGDVDADDIRALDLAKSEGVYKQRFWERNHYGLLNDQRVATKMLDLAVNMGSGQANKLLQRCVGVKDDGVCGQGTITAANNFLGNLYNGLIEKQVDFYRSVASSHPDQRANLNGWLNRAYDKCD